MWDPPQQYLIHKLEIIQHRAIRFVLNRVWQRNHQESITELLQQQNWSTLVTQQRYARLTLLYKVFNKIMIISQNIYPHHPPL